MTVRGAVEGLFGDVRTGRIAGCGWTPRRTFDVRERFELGALGTGSHRFYERLGWRSWAGPSFVRTAGGALPTPDEDGFILVLPTRASPPMDFAAPISCEWRPGDVW